MTTAPPVSPPEEVAQPGNERLVTAAVALTTILAPLNSTMIIVALPSIVRDFHTGVSSASWLVTSYLIVMAALQPVAGKVGDRLGRRRLVMGSLLYFGVVSLAAAFAPSLAVLVIWRVQQGIAAAIAIPNVAALVRETVPQVRRASVFGTIGAVTSVGAAVGPALGGGLTQAFGWQAIFSVNVVPIAVALVLTYRAIPVVPARKQEHRFDLAGAILFSLLLLALSALLAAGLRAGFGPAVVVGAVAFVAVLLLFLRQELRHPDPTLPLRLYRSRSFVGASGAVAASNLSMYSLLVSLPIILSARGLSPGRIGLLLVALSAANVVGAPLGGRLSDRFGRRWPSAAGLALFTVALIPLVVAGDSISLALLSGCLAVAGIALGLSWPGLQAASLESVPGRDAGLASGLFSTSRYLGSITGTSVLGALLHQAHPAPSSVEIAFWMVLLVALVSVAFALTLRSRPGVESR